MAHSSSTVQLVPLPVYPRLQTQDDVLPLAVHRAVEAQTTPHAPQFVGLVAMSTHAPPHLLGVAPLQLKSHPVTVQMGDPVPVVGAGHFVPHWPQLLMSPPRSTHAPPHLLSVVPLQLRSHPVAAHFGEPLPAVGAGHFVPQ